MRDNRTLYIYAVTSRPKGEYEVDGDNCWFVSNDEIVTGIESDEFLEVGCNE